MYYCFKCDIAGDIGYLWNGKVTCFNCGGNLEEKSYEWIKSQGVTEVIEPQRKEMEDAFP